MSNMLRTPLYFKRFGLRRPTHILNPRLFPIISMQLPRSSVYHYLADSIAITGPRSDGPILSKTPKVNYIIHVTDFESNEGNPRPTFKLPNPIIMDYRRKNRKVRPVKKIDNAVRDPKSLLTVNYSILPITRKYIRNRMAAYYEWYNIMATVYKGIETMAVTTANMEGFEPRNQFFEIHLPDELPPLNMFRMGSNSLSKRVLEEFNNNDKLTLLDLWRWVGPNPEQSLLWNKLDASVLDRVFFIMKTRSSWMVINLGRLNEWVKRPGEDEGVDPITFQLRFYNFLSRFYDNHYVSPEDDAEDIVDDSDDTEDDSVDNSIVNEVNVISEEEQDELDRAAELERLDEMDDEILASTMDEIEAAENEDEELSEELDYVQEDDVPYDDDEEDEYAEREKIIARNGIINNSNDVDNVTTSHERAILTKAIELADAKVISQPQLKRLEAAASTYKDLPDPHDPTQTVAEAIKVKKEDLVLKPAMVPDMPEVRDKSMLSSTVGKSNEHYINNVLKRDVLSAVMGVQQTPVAVTDIETHVVKDAVSDYTVYRVSLLPVTGKPSRIEFRLPNVKPDGKFISNGTQYRMRAQRTDLPIVKVSESRVALNSSYGKVMVELSPKVRFNYDKFIGEQLVAMATDADNQLITNPSIVNVANYDTKLPRIYNIISRYITSFDMMGLRWQFDHEHREFPDDDAVKKIEKDGMVVVASGGTKHIAVDYDDVFYEIVGGELKPLGNAEEVFGIDSKRVPLPMTELKVFGKDIPVGVVLGYLMGVDNLLKLLKAKYRMVAVGERVNLLPDEYGIQFKDETLVLDRGDLMTTMIMSGFTVFNKFIKRHNFSDFNRKLVYGHVLDQAGINLRYVRELDLMDSMFVDPITRDLLEWMREPTKFRQLLHRATEMLLLPQVPKRVEGIDGIVSNLERTRGYERFASVVYSEMVKSLRQYNTRNITNNSQITMNPHAVWTRIVSDGATSVVNELNPIENLKEIEVITYGGDMGRSKRSMVASTRIYKDTDIGAISESTVDSGDVGVIAYRSPNAVETTVRGTVRKFDEEKDGISSLFSTSSLLFPCADRDDPKRINLGAIQQSHMVATVGGKASSLRTGYEQVVAHRVDGLFANTAKKAGKVVKVTPTAITIANKDGTDTVHPLGREFGTSVGTTIPHLMVTQFKEGDTIKEGDVVTYNDGYFEPSIYSKGQVAWISGVSATTAIMESAYTIEDSSAISLELADKLATNITTKKPITVRFDQSVTGLVKPGDKVELDSPLCVIEDDFISRSNLFSSMTEEQLRYMSANVPRAGVVGVVEKVEVFYHGDKDDLSESLTAIVNADERRRKATAKELQTQYVSGKVDQSLRINGEGLAMNNVVIYVYITYMERMGIGDKGSFGNQLKTVIGRFLTGVNETEDGKPIEAVMGMKSIQDRIVLSMQIMVTTNTLCRHIGETWARKYLSNK